ncbi:GTP cyclohydrolase II RibA, partial [Gammaproteobacteria bacterium]|nr:GTP cyclohydrolase II RibA [Gammaproteobacteria bacterium]
TPFTVSIDARNDITTGVSAIDRAKTVLSAIDDNAKPEDLDKPGHIFPLCAKKGGVLERPGHTEGAVDLMKLSGLKPSAVLCELMNSDGTMTRGKQLEIFAKDHDLLIISIQDIIDYRLCHENLVIEQSDAYLPLDPYGKFKISVVKESITGLEHTVLENINSSKNKDTPTLVRIHSACFTGDVFGSLRCDCHQQLHYSLKRISEEGGILIYLNQEGRGVGLLNKIKAYALQEKGFDTIEANEELGLPVDSRNYHLAANILKNKSINFFNWSSCIGKQTIPLL